MTIIGVTREEVLVEVADFMQDEVIEDLPRADLRAGVAIEVEVESLLDDLDAVLRDRNVVIHSVAVQPGDAEAYAHQPRAAHAAARGWRARLDRRRAPDCRTSRRAGCPNPRADRTADHPIGAEPSRWSREHEELAYATE